MIQNTIWYISKYASPLKYGFASRHFSFAKEFNKLGFKTHVISSDSNHIINFPSFPKLFTHEVIEGVDTWWVRTKRYKGANSTGRIISWLDFEVKLFFLCKKIFQKPEIVIVSSLSLLTILNGILLKRRYKCKLLFEIRDIWPLTIIEIGGFSPRNPFIKILTMIEKIGYKQADVIVGTMPNLSEHVKKIIGPNEKCVCIPQGIDLTLYKKPDPLPDEYIAKYVPSDKFIIGYAGSIGKSNGLDTLIAAANKLKNNMQIHFLLIGDGDQLDQLKSASAEFNNITFAPKLKKTQVQSVLQYCNVLYDSVLNIGLYNYGLSRNKWIDYMYAGKPIIASYSGFLSMINEAKSGVFIPAEDVKSLINAIDKFYNMPSNELINIGLNGKNWLLKNRRFENLAIDYVKNFG